jgi:hypothetical protein
MEYVHVYIQLLAYDFDHITGSGNYIILGGSAIRNSFQAVIVILKVGHHRFTEGCSLSRNHI